MASLQLSLCTMKRESLVSLGRSLAVSLALALSPMAVGCGGASAAKGGTTTPANAAKDESGNVVRSGSGAAVTKEAEASGKEALAAFEAAEKGGWNESTCESVSDGF